jgi:hypothetical protein
MEHPMTSKIRIKLGPIEVEYEGSESFLKAELPDLLAAVAKLYKESGVPQDAPKFPLAPSGGGAPAPAGLHGGTTATLAAKLDVKSGPELILAACARIALVSGRASFTRKQIIDEMRGATGYYKKTYFNNLTKYLQQLVKDQKLVEPTNGSFALSVPTRTQLEKQLAEP